MKFFNIFSKENRNKLDDEQIKNFEGKDIAKSNRAHEGVIKGYENTLAENKKLKQGRKIKREFAWEKAKTAIRLNLKNLTSLDDIGTEKQSESNRIKKEYEERLGALNLSEKQKSILESGTYSKKAVRQSNKDARKGIRKQKRKIASNNRQAFLTKSLRKGRKVGLFALGVITTPAKLAVDGSKLVADGIVQGAKAVNKTVLRPARAIVKTMAHSYATSSKKYKAGDGLAKNCVRAFREKASTKVKSVGDSIRATTKSAQVSFNKLKANYAKRQASKYARMFREAQAKTQ